MTRLINVARAKALALEIAATRANHLTRVSATVYDHLDSLVRNEVERIVRYHPSIGKTISMGRRPKNAQDPSQE